MLTIPRDLRDLVATLKVCKFCRFEAVGKPETLSAPVQKRSLIWKGMPKYYWTSVAVYNGVFKRVTSQVWGCGRWFCRIANAQML